MRLIDMGVAEENALKLATDRNMSDIKEMTIEQIAVCLGKTTESEEVTAVMDALANYQPEIVVGETEEVGKFNLILKCHKGKSYNVCVNTSN